MIYRFGPFELDESAGELRRGGEAVPIQPKPLALLGLLIRERERIVSQDELLDALWPDTAVTPGSLTRAVSHARRAIGDTHKGEVLRSVPRRGYRFAGDVIEVDAAAEPARAPGSAEAFVGRADALAKLDEAWLQAQGGQPRLILVEGAPGIGKTRLTEVFTRGAGGQVVVGRCREGEGLPDLWLWTQVLRGLVDAAAIEPGHDLEGLLGDAGRAPEEERFLFFHSVARALCEAARARPLILVLEDLQWAQPASLRLLEHVVFEVEDARLLVIATVRREERPRGHPVDRTLAMLRRSPRCDDVDLSGLSRAAVGEYLTLVIGRAPPAELTSELFARTEGVPLFVREAVRQLEERGELEHPERIRRRGITLPDRAIDLIRHALDALSGPCAELVGAGSVLGRDFTPAAAAALAGVDRGDALDRLDEAIRAGVLAEVEDAAATYRFTHALFQESAYEGLKASTRARLHARAAERLETRYAGDATPVLSELAHHHLKGIAVGDPERAFECALAAAEQANRTFAYEEAAAHYEDALHALEHLESVEPGRRLAVLIQLGEAHRLAGDRPRRLEVCTRAMEEARALGRAEEYAEAAIGFCDVSEWSPEDPEAARAVDEALASLEPDQNLLRARLTTRRAYLDIRRSSSRDTARHAVELARACGDPSARQEALYVLLYTLAGPDHLAERRELIGELAEVARACPSRDTAVIAALDVACDHLSLGDREAAARLREEAGALAGESPSPTKLWHMRVFDNGLDLLEGHLDRVEQQARDTLLIGRRIDHPYAQACCNGQLMQLHRYRGEYDAVQVLFARAIGSRLGPNHWARAIVGRNEWALGNEARARELFDDVATDDFAGIARGIRWIGTLVETAHLCADLGEGERAETLCTLLSPVEEQHGVLPVPILYGGPVRYCLARLSDVLGMPRQATEHYEQALERAREMRAEPLRAQIGLDFSRLLRRLGQESHAAEQERDARSRADALGLALG